MGINQFDWYCTETWLAGQPSVPLTAVAFTFSGSEPQLLTPPRFGTLASSFRARVQAVPESLAV
jgi:hypothetical protein